MKTPPQRTEKVTNTLNRISEKSINNATYQKNSPLRQTRSSVASTSSGIKAAGATKLKGQNVINETMDADETSASLYEDAVAKPPVMNSTMNPNTTVTLERMMNVTVLIEPIPNKKVFDETVTIQKASTMNKLSSTENREVDPVQKKSVKESTNNGGTNKHTLRIEQFNELITDDESSPERKEYKMKKNKQAAPPKRTTRSSQNSTVSDADEIERTPMKILPSKEFKSTLTKAAAFKQPALFSPYSKDSVKKRVEAFEQVASSPKFEKETTGRVTRTKTRALAAASTQEENTPNKVAQKLARKSLAKAKKISLAKQARENDEAKEVSSKKQLYNHFVI